MVETLQWVIRVALAVLFVGMGALHFVPATARGMAAIVPVTITRRVAAPALVFFTGLCEIAGGLGLLVPSLRLAAGISLVVFLVAVFPANSFAAQHPERFGRAAIPFWPRYFAQLALILLLLVAIV